jgi:hypothetical protein
MLLINPYRFAAPEIPQTVSGLQLWLDATTGLYDATSGGSVVAADSAAVARWEDRSGNARHFTQSIANNRPVLRTAQLNGKNIVSFDGSNDFLLTGSNPLLRNVSGYSFFAVRKNKTSVSTNKTLFANTGTNLRFEFITSSTNRSYIRARRLSTDTLASINAANNNSTFASFELFSSVVDHANTSAKLYKNASLNATNASFLTSGSTYDSNGQSVIAAQNPAGTLQIADIEIAEILIYHGALSDADRGKIESYLTTKWGL